MNKEEILELFEALYKMNRQELMAFVASTISVLFDTKHDRAFHVFGINAGSGMVIERAIAYAVIALVPYDNANFMRLRIAYFADKLNGDFATAKLSWMAPKDLANLASTKRRVCSQMLEALEQGE